MEEVIWRGIEGECGVRWRGREEEQGQVWKMRKDEGREERESYSMT